MASLSMVIAENIGWRITMFLCAIVGGCITILLMTTVTEPTRQGALKKKNDDKVPILLLYFSHFPLLIYSFFLSFPFF